MIILGKFRHHDVFMISSTGHLLVFHENTAENAYATLFFAEYDDACRGLRYANCGHVPALLLRGAMAAGEAGFDGHGAGAVLGVGLLESGERRLSAGDVLALYTDGITESCRRSGGRRGIRGRSGWWRPCTAASGAVLPGALGGRGGRSSAVQPGRAGERRRTLTVAKCR